MVTRRDSDEKTQINPWSILQISDEVNEEMLSYTLESGSATMHEGVTVTKKCHIRSLYWDKPGDPFLDFLTAEYDFYDPRLKSWCTTQPPILLEGVEQKESAKWRVVCLEKMKAHAKWGIPVILYNCAMGAMGIEANSHDSGQISHSSVFSKDLNKLPNYVFYMSMHTLKDSRLTRGRDCTVFHSSAPVGSLPEEAKGHYKNDSLVFERRSMRKPGLAGVNYELKGDDLYPAMVWGVDYID